jgi:hypothetical protein
VRMMRTANGENGVCLHLLTVAYIAYIAYIAYTLTACTAATVPRPEMSTDQKLLKPM